MVGWRDKKRGMLGDVHRHFGIPAVYLANVQQGTPLAVNVRLHRKQIVERPPLGTQDEVASMLMLHDRIIFDKREIPDIPEGVLQRSYVIFSDGETYVTGPAKPERDGYVWVEVSDMRQDDLDELVQAIRNRYLSFSNAFSSAFGREMPALWGGILT